MKQIYTEMNALTLFTKSRWTVFLE